MNQITTGDPIPASSVTWSMPIEQISVDQHLRIEALDAVLRMYEAAPRGDVWNEVSNLRLESELLFRWLKDGDVAYGDG